MPDAKLIFELRFSEEFRKILFGGSALWNLPEDARITHNIERLNNLFLLFLIFTEFVIVYVANNTSPCSITYGDSPQFFELSSSQHFVIQRSNPVYVVLIRFTLLPDHSTPIKYNTE